MDIRMSNGHTVGHHKQIRIVVTGALRRDQVKLNRPVPQSRYVHRLLNMGTPQIQSRHRRTTTLLLLQAGKILVHRLLVERNRLPLNDPQRILWAVTQTGPEPVAVDIADQPGLTIHYLNGPLSTIRDAQAAAVAKILIYLHDLPLH
jgi:hypothetical protein